MYSFTAGNDYQANSTYIMTLADLYEGQSVEIEIKKIALSTSPSKAPEIDTSCQQNTSRTRTADQLTITGGNGQLSCTGVRGVSGVKYTLTPDSSSHLTFTLVTGESHGGFLLQFSGL